ncbi:MAG: hypothetical protein Tsb0014_02190 [Pleurocapsa sp.]
MVRIPPTVSPTAAKGILRNIRKKLFIFVNIVYSRARGHAKSDGIWIKIRLKPKSTKLLVNENI